MNIASESVLADASAQRVAHQVATLESQRVDRAEHRAHVVDQVVLHARRQMIGMAMARQFERDHLPAFGQQRGESRIAPRIVQPTMQGQQRRRLLVAPYLRAQAQMRQPYLAFDRAIHAEVPRRGANADQPPV